MMKNFKFQSFHQEEVSIINTHLECKEEEMREYIITEGIIENNEVDTLKDMIDTEKIFNLEELAIKEEDLE